MAARSLPNARSLYVTGIADYDTLRKVLVQAVERAVTGKQDAKAALDEAVLAWDKKLAKLK
jgi:putative chitobiose transport system substrate-binding protein